MKNKILFFAFLLLGLASCAHDGKAQSLTSNITAYYRFDEAFPTNFTILPTYADATGRGNTLTVNPDQRVQPSNLHFRIGANSSGTQTLDGNVAAWGKWNRLLTNAEKTALAGGETWPFSTTTSLQDAVAYYLLNEPTNSATYADATGRGNTLTLNGSTIQTTGPSGIPLATRITPGSFLDSVATADLQIGNSNFTVFGWYNLHSKGGGGTAQQIFWGQVDIADSPATTGAVLYYEDVGNSINLDIGNGIDLFGNATTVIPSSVSSPTIDTWYSVLGQFNATSSAMPAEINNNSGITGTFNRNIQPGAVPAKINNGAQFQASTLFVDGVSSGWDNSTSGPVTRAVAPATNDLTFGNNSRTVWYWLKATNTSTTQSIAGFMSSTTGNQLDWMTQVGSNSLFFETGNSNNTFQFITVPFTDTSSFHLLVCWYDKTAGTINMNLDHGAQTATKTISGYTPARSTLPFGIGANMNGSQTPGNPYYAQQFIGIIDEMGIANGVPTSTDLDMLWNGGAGWTYPSPPAFSGQMRGNATMRGSAVIR